MTTGIGPYEQPVATSDATATGTATLEFTLTASHEMVDIGIGMQVEAEVFNGAIPGPTLKLQKDDTVVVRLVNNLSHSTGIHWHGIELANHMDGTEVTQDGLVEGPGAQTLHHGPPAPGGTDVPAGGTFLYKFKVTRPGLFWYHPHHHNSMNRLFRGMYGMIVVTDPGEASIVSTAVTAKQLPPDTDTMQVVLSDTTVSRSPNPTRTYPDPALLALDDQPEWLGDLAAAPGVPITAQDSTATPDHLCEVQPVGTLTPTQWATDDDGVVLAVGTPTPYTAGKIPSMNRPTGTINTVEGNIVLTNGVNAGLRLGKPGKPGNLVTTAAIPGPPALMGTPPPKIVQRGQGLRLQIVSCSILRYFRLYMTYPDGAGNGVQIPLFRVGGEGGILDRAILEGGNIGFVTDYDPGEILLPPATRADVVAVIPTTGLPDDTVITLWTCDFKRIGRATFNNWAQLPTVAVMHFKVTGARASAYTINASSVSAPSPTDTLLRGPTITGGMPLVVDLTPAVTASFLAPPAGAPAHPVTGFDNLEIKLSTDPGVPVFDDVAPPPGSHFFMPPAGPFPFNIEYAHIAHIETSRYAAPGGVLELKLTNKTAAHHPYHLHGFSFQPMSIVPWAGAPTPPTGSYTWTYKEFRDTIDIPPKRTLTFRVRLDPRNLPDEVTPGGAVGRWLMHCHIFFHHEHGMISELVALNGNVDRPCVSVGGSWTFTTVNTVGMATRSGQYHNPNGTAVTITAKKADGVTDIGTITGGGAATGQWDWQYDSPLGDPPRKEYVYIHASDGVRKDMAVFRLQVGTDDDGSDRGDPHIKMIDGTRYDFQAAGEFVLLRDRDGMEIQVRQTPAETPPPITDDYSGLRACVSLNSAMAARVGGHKISYQQPGEPGRYRFFVDGKPAPLTPAGLDLGGDRVSAFDSGSQSPGLRIDYAHGPIVLVTPLHWDSYNIPYLDIAISRTNANEGLMGGVAKGSWLPVLRNGASLGPRPEGLLERYIALYRTFADSWRVTGETSLFYYLPGTSTATFTDRDWPHPPVTAVATHTHATHDGPVVVADTKCVVKPGFQKPLKPILHGISVEEARRICAHIKGAELHDACVFDVASTGDPHFVKGYEIAQEQRLHTTCVHIATSKTRLRLGETVTFTAVVSPLAHGRPTPTGTVTFFHHTPQGSPVPLDSHGRAKFATNTLHAGAHAFRAIYTPDGAYRPSSSANVSVTVIEAKPGPGPGGDGTGTTGTGTGRPCGVHGKIDCKEWLCRALRNVCRALHDCIERIAPCECGGDHARKDHPAPGGDAPAPAEPPKPEGGGHQH